MLSAALLLCLASALLLYLASPRQRLRAAPLRRWACAAALLSGAGGIAAWIAVLGPGAGSFGALTTLMLGWAGLPYLAWYLVPEERR